MNIVVMPGHSRPEMFEVWTELIKKAEGASELLYVFCLDYNYKREYKDLISKFPYKCSIIEMGKTRYSIGKQSNNVLNGLIAAATHTDNLVYYIEEDVFIGVDFFRWHEEIHNQNPDLFCSVASKSNNTKYSVVLNPDHYYLTTLPDYQALGSCFKKGVILNQIGPHFNESYLSSPMNYCLREFPGSKIGKFFAEQDGLIRRILERSGQAVAYPCYPFCYHAGFYGYNRSTYVMRKPYAEKLAMIRDICFDVDKMKAHSDYDDSTPVDLATRFKTLKRVDVEKIK